MVASTCHETEVGHSIVVVQDTVPAEGSTCLGVVVGIAVVVVGIAVVGIAVVEERIADRRVEGFAAAESH